VSRPFSLRRYTEADEAEAVALWVSVWQTVYPDIDYASQYDALRQRWRDEIVPPAIITLALTDSLIGLITVEPASGYVDQLAVAPHMWGTGLALTLIEEAWRLSPTLLELRVNQDNARAIRFYAKHGFVKVGERFNERLGKPQFTMRWTPAPR
jgi:putative acetyltransferase